MEKYLTIDIGGTFMKYSLMDKEFNSCEDGSIPTKKEPDEFLAQLMELIKSYAPQISGVAVCIAGFLDPVSGENSDYSVGKNFTAFNLKKEIDQRFHLPVSLENDSNCAALGEMIFGAGKDYKNICMVTFGTGIGGAVIINRELYRGSHFKGGEVDFTVVGMQNFDKTLDKKIDKKIDKNLEAKAACAMAGLTNRVSKALGHKVDGAYIFKHIDEPEIFCIYKEWLCDAAIVIGNFAVTLDPEVMLIGGGISENDRFITDITQTVYQLFPHLEDYTKIRACKTGNLAGRVGALYLLLKDGGRV